MDITCKKLLPKIIPSNVYIVNINAVRNKPIFKDFTEMLRQNFLEVIRSDLSHT